MEPNKENRIPADQLQVIIYNTIAVLTGLPGRDEWLALLVQAQAQAGQFGNTPEQEFFAALVDLLRGVRPALPDGHPYASVLQLVLDGVASMETAIAKATETAEAEEAATASGGNGKGPSAGTPAGGESAAAGTAAGDAFAGMDAHIPSDGHPADLPAELEPYVIAVTALLDAPDWGTALAQVRRDQVLLFDERTEQVFAIFLARAMESGDQQAVDYIANHRAFVRACKRDGFDAMAARLQ